MPPRPTLRGIAFALVCLWPAPSAAAMEGNAVAAVLGDRSITISEIDKRSAPKVARSHTALQQLHIDAVDRHIDAALRLSPQAPVLPGPARVTEEEVERFGAQNPDAYETLEGPARAGAIRFSLENRAIRAWERETREKLRVGHEIEYLTPEGYELERTDPARVVARLDGAPVRAAVVEFREALRLYRVRGGLYRERTRNLEVHVHELLLDRAAKQAGITVEELEEGLVGEVVVTESELAEFLAKTEYAKPERARPYLEFVKRYERLKEFTDAQRSEQKYEVMLRAPTLPTFPVEDADAPSLGPSGGPRLVVYSNLGCAVCLLQESEIDRLRSMVPDVRIVFRSFLPQFDPGGRQAAMLAHCAGEQGAFEAMRARLRATERPKLGDSWLRAEERASAIAELNLDGESFDRCVESSSTRYTLERDTERARALGFTTAPAFVAEGVPLSGMQGAESLAQALELGKSRTATPDASRPSGESSR